MGAKLTPEVRAAQARLAEAEQRWARMSTEERAAAWQRVREAQREGAREYRAMVWNGGR
jgi:acyl-CoA reductase-like NAD-dependent aldehyde dehydrogenase